MKRRTLPTLLVTSLLLAGIQGRAQDLPKTQPKFISIVRESVKAGKSAEHAKHEAGWPAAFEKVKSPDYYIAMTSLTGPTEAWYVIPWESHAKLGETMQREIKDEALTKELERLAEKDADYIDGVRIVQARARADLSIGEFPDLAKTRFFHITTMRLRVGQEQLFEEAAKAYAAVMKRGAPDASYRIYEVMAGMPGPTYIIFSSVNAFADFDERLRNGIAAWKGATAEELGVLQKCGTEAIVESESNRFRLDPRQSYVPKETREKDPEFWKGK